MAREQLRRVPLWAVQAVVSGVSLAAVLWWALRQDAPAMPDSAHAVGAVGVALAAYAVATAARAERWHRIVAANDIRATRSETYALTLVCYMGNNVLPARGGDLLRVFLLGNSPGASRRGVLGTVVAERLLDAAALAAVLAVVVFGVLPNAALPELPPWLLLALLLPAALVLVLINTRLSRARAWFRPVWGATRGLAGARGGALLALSLALWGVEALVYVVVGRAVGVDLTVGDALYVVALTNLFAMIPAGPGYVGTFDAAVLFGIGSLGFSGADALGYLLLLRFTLFVPITLAGLAVFLARYGGLARLRAARG